MCVTGCWAAKSLTYAQQTEIRLESGSKTLGEVFSEIEKKSEFIFFYKENVVDLNKIVKVDGRKHTIEEILNMVLDQSTVSYEILDRQVVFSRKKVADIAESLSSGEQQQNGIRVTGTVKDVRGEVIIGANVIEKGTANGVATDLNGNFALTVQSNAVLQISYVGYISQEISALTGGG
ncbi:MAG: carboxypeptidase-like regulatory domain-containing protein [Tannerella sp.]|nr:carboxypeptidase-like regulatory domain-containing protein [Tannerella sp.]